MKLCVVSCKDCWQDEKGNWFSYGGFPMQMAAIGSLFEEMWLLVPECAPQEGGLPLPAHAHVVPLRRPVGQDARRKLSVLAHLPHYITTIMHYERQVDVVHIPVPGDISLLGLLTAILLRKRIIARYGGSWQVTPETTYVDAFIRLVMRAFAGGRKVMLATGIGANPPAPGMNWVFSTALDRRQLDVVQPDLDRLPCQPWHLVYAGRLSPEKGLIHLIEAMAILRNLLQSDDCSHPLPDLTIIGDGPQRAGLGELVARYGLGEHVHFTGQVDRAILVRHLQESDILVLPSLTEGFPKARLDAMFCGVPVITTSAGFGGETTGAPGERGWVVPAGNSEALAETLRKLLSETIDWPALHRRCREYAEQFTLELWSWRIGEFCAVQWNMSLSEGRLKA